MLSVPTQMSTLTIYSRTRTRTNLTTGVTLTKTSTALVATNFPLWRLLSGRQKCEHTHNQQKLRNDRKFTFISRLCKQSEIGLFGTVCCHWLHQSKSARFDFGNGVVAGLLEFFVGGLKLLQLFVEGLASVLDGFFLLSDLCRQVFGRQSHETFDFLAVVFFAQVQVFWGTHWFQVFFGKLGELFEVTPTFVVLQVVGVTVL